MKILVLGAGGHGRVVADILLRMREAGRDVEPVGYLDDDASLHGKKFLGIRVLGPFDALPTVRHDAVVVALGDNAVREKVFRRLDASGENFITARHPCAVIPPDVSMGKGCMICAGVVVNTGTKIGDNTILNTSASVDHDNIIGDHVHIAPGVVLGGDVIVGNGVLIGIGATVMPRKTVNAKSVVGSGAVVCGNIPAGVLVSGIPAKEHKTS
ncbi:MAG: acetyltransferase [Thermodesulfobacteriota bacterium]|nr:acetyltransferase [Thermodesulfobacteriota bacterium]